jgi:hypothetical protein
LQSLESSRPRKLRHVILKQADEQFQGSRRVVLRYRVEPGLAFSGISLS